MSEQLSTNSTTNITNETIIGETFGSEDSYYIQYFVFIVTGVVVLVAIVGFVLFALIKRRNSKDNDSDTASEEELVDDALPFPVTPYEEDNDSEDKSKKSFKIEVKESKY